MKALRFLLALPFRLVSLVSGAAGVALVAFSLGFLLLAELLEA